MQDCGKVEHDLQQLREKCQRSCKSPVLSPVRDRQASWDAREMRTATTKVRRETYETFRRLCKERKSTPYAELRDFLLAFVEYFGGGGTEPDDDPVQEPEEEPFTGWHTTD